MGKRVLVAARDLFFRSKLAAVVTGAGGEVVRDESACDLAVVELGGGDAEARIIALVGRGIPVLAFGSHVKADALRAARALGARAVPNSEIESALRARMTNPQDRLLLRKSPPYRRSALLIAAYCALGAAFVLALAGAGVYWAGGAAGLAVVLAIGAIAARGGGRQSPTG